jgi:NAD(P)-dependent dehydrogenase (short-subunit alcohol dehydrogenase family)
VTSSAPPPYVIDLAGRTIIVTGAASGIGAATARLLHAAGATPALADVDPRSLGPLARSPAPALTSDTEDQLHPKPALPD